MRQDIIFTLRGLGEVFDKTITPELIQIWVKVLGELSPDEISKAVKVFLVDPSNVFFPRPGQIYGLARPEEDAEEQASILADSVFMALRAYGYDKEHTQKAKERVGEIAWEWILRQGGWEVFCKSVTNEDDVPILKSQCRKSIKGLINRKRNSIPLLPEGRLMSLSGLGLEMKSLAKGSTDESSQTNRTGTHDD